MRRFWGRSGHRRRVNENDLDATSCEDDGKEGGAEMATAGDISIYMVTTTNDKQGRTGMEANDGDNREDNMIGDVRERGGMKCR